MLGFEPEAEELVIDMADVGRTNGIGEAPPVLGDAAANEDGCCRIAKTKVLLIASFSHCG